MAATTNQPASILRLAQVISRTGLSRSTIYQRIYEDDFPRQINLGANSVGWVEAEIDEWIATRIEQSRKAA
jgi:prophage regulatory protein